MSTKEWTKIGTDTYYFPGPCNVGICNGMVIHGADWKSAPKAAGAMADAGLTPRWLLNTHGHGDHYGGDGEFMKLGAELLATREQTPWIEQPDIDTTFSYSARNYDRGYEPPDFIVCGNFDVQRTIVPGKLELDGNVFTLTEHFGHAMDQLAIETPDKVMFIGDILMAEKALEYFRLPQLISVKQSLADIQFVAESDAQCFVVAHGKVLEDPKRLCEMNTERILQVVQMVFDYCASPRTRDEIAGHILVRLDVPCLVGNGIMAHSLAGAVLAYLIDENRVDLFFDDARVMRYRQA